MAHTASLRRGDLYLGYCIRLVETCPEQAAGVVEEGTYYLRGITSGTTDHATGSKRDAR